MGEKATKAQMVQRVDEVFRLLVDGLDTADILELISEKYGVDEKTAAYYITKANKELARLTSASQAEVLRIVLENLNDVLKETRRDKNYTCALGALSQIAKLHGLEKIVVQIRDEYQDLSDDEVISEIESRESLPN